MPRYDYECESCHNVFELRQSFDADTVTECLDCKGIARRKFHAVPVMFKGSGWYVNDYGKTGGSTATTPKETTNSDSAPKSESKSEKSSEAASTSASTSKSSKES